MSTLKNTRAYNTINFDLKFPESALGIMTTPSTKQKFISKTNLPAMPNSVKTKQSGAVSRASQHRWPQAVMVVMGGTERQIYNTDMLTVTTNANILEEKNEDRSNGVKETSDLKFSLPEISVSAAAINNDQEGNQIPNRFTAKSPSKLTQLPAFSKSLLNEDQAPPDKKNIKLIKSIKFWRGTTPRPQINKKEKLGSEEKLTTKVAPSKKRITDKLSKNDSVLQSWTEHLSIFEESSKNKYFSWQMALRNRLLKHEKMYYQEAVSRINKYRQQLRMKQALGPTSRDVPSNMDPQLWKDLIQQHSKKHTFSSSKKLTGVRMSPSQEWKPYVFNENGKSGNKSPYFEYSSTFQEPKKKDIKEDEMVLCYSSSKKSKYQPRPEIINSQYPVHGKALLKEDLKKVKTALPTINTSSPFLKDRNVDNENLKKSDEANENQENASARALLVNLKNQLLFKNENDIEKKDIKDSPKLIQGKTGLGMKLKLLLQTTSKSEQGRNHSSMEKTRQMTSSRRKLRSKLRSQQNGYRPISRPRTIGDGSLPKIHNIVNASLLRHQGNSKIATKINATKHRLTLAGVAKREAFSSSVIGIAQKHINMRPNDFESKLNNGFQSKDKIETTFSTIKSLDPKQEELLDGVNLEDKKFDNAEPIAHAAEHILKLKTKKNPANRFCTAATIQQHQFPRTTSLSRIQEKDNLQFRSLKLTAFAEKKSFSPPTTPPVLFQARQQALKGRGKLKTNKHKVLRPAVVEPPLTAKERFERQQEAERSRKRLTFNPTHAALSKFTTTLLNSELDLRAPSSSPVDMFFRSYNHSQDEKEINDYWAFQKRTDVNRGRNFEMHYINNPRLVNEMDGLTFTRKPVQVEGNHLSKSYNTKQKKSSTIPKEKDFVDLQRLYQAMQKHGETYTTGSAYFYTPTPNMGLDGLVKHPPSKIAHHKSQNKTPFYYYPYHGDTNIQALDENEGAPLYVVTGASSMATNKSSDRTIQSRKPVRYFDREEFAEDLDDSISTPFRHVVNYSKFPLAHWNSAEPGSGSLSDRSKRALTVIMPKTPGITMPTSMPISHLEQIQEHVFQ